MKQRDNISPPKYYERFFEWFCRPEYFEELQGDLAERFERNYQTLGQGKASRIYKREVLKLFRPSVIKKINTQNHFNNITMFKNYSLVALRSIARNKLFSTINVIGLSISMAVGLLAIAFLDEVYSFDQFHENGDRIYRVINTLHEGEEEPAYYATTSPKTGQVLAEEYGGYEKLVIIYKNFSGDAKKGDNIIPLRGHYVTEEFFEIFTFPLIQGDKSTALSEPYSLVLTEESALKLFDRTDIVGETVLWNNRPYKVTGVTQNVPKNSHMQFQALTSFKTLQARKSSNRYLMNWDNMWNSHVYVLMPEGASTKSLEASLVQIQDRENFSPETFRVEMELQALDDIFPSKQLYNQLGPRMEISKIRSMIILSLIVLFSACFNYTNLSIARTLKRSKEVGVRKVVGARKGQILIQFIFEAIIISLIALAIAILLFRWMRPAFLSMDQNIQRFITMELSTVTYLYFLLFSVAIGVLAGMIPSFVLAKLKPVSILKSGSNLSRNKGFSFRKVLIGLQFTLSMAFVIMVSLTNKQYNYVIDYELGFVTDDILNIRLQGNDAQTVTNGMSQIPGVQKISKSSSVPSIGGMWRDKGKFIEGNDSTMLYNLQISRDYLENLNHELIAGSTFSETDGLPEIIINEKVVERFNLGSPLEALGKTIQIRKKNRKIVGVVKDFHYATLDNEVEPFVFMNEKNEFNLINLKLSDANVSETMIQIEEAWNEIDPTHPMVSRFYKDGIERAYSNLSTSMKTIGILALIAVSISMLGLLGMAVYTTETRIKELTIRKVLGADINSLVKLLSKNYLILFLLSAGVAIPVTYYAFKSMIISGMVYTISIGPVELGTGALAVLVIALLTISGQTLKAVKKNPVEHLRNE